MWNRETRPGEIISQSGSRSARFLSRAHSSPGGKSAFSSHLIIQDMTMRARRGQLKWLDQALTIGPERTSGRFKAKIFTFTARSSATSRERQGRYLRHARIEGTGRSVIVTLTAPSFVADRTR